jgi:penicillin-binding protein 2
VTRLSTARSPGDVGLERRIITAIGFVLVIWIVLLARIFYLQLVQGEEFRVSAQRQSVRTHRVEATRGIIFDRRGRILADSRPAFDVLVVPQEVSSLDETLTRIATLASLDPAAVRERLGRPSGRARFQALPVATDLERRALARVEARLWALNGVLTRVSPVRYYPHGRSAAHVLGTLGEISAGQLEQRQFARYRRGDVIGQSGVEGLFDSDLRGRAGGRNVLVDAYGRELELLGEVEPQPGLNLALTLDLRLQLLAESALEETGKSGAVVALDPRSGEVLVLANRPSPDPNLFATGIDPQAWSDLLNDARKPLQNRALRGQYPPGSTYKVVTAIAGLEEGKVTPETEVYCGGSYRLGRRRYRCWKRGGHGVVRLHKALVQSCDVYFYQLAREVGVDRLAYYARALGLGRPTGIEFKPEAAGLVPTRAWKQRRFGERWIEGETLSIGIGQGFNLWTPIQLAVAYASIGTGRRMRPYTTQRVESPLGEVLRNQQPEVLGELPISAETLSVVRAGLRGVVQDPRGTGYVMRRLPGAVEAAGKTGTAQVVAMAQDPVDEEELPEEHRDHAWFVTYAPAEAPEIVVAVLVEHGGHGSSGAAPIARRVVEAFLEDRMEAHAGD